MVTGGSDAMSQQILKANQQTNSEIVGLSLISRKTTIKLSNNYPLNNTHAHTWITVT